jgi:hypothetical protein
MEGHRDGPLAARGSCCDPMALLVAGRAVCRFAAARLANMGSVDDPASCRQPCIRTKPHPAMGENRTRCAAEQARTQRSGPSSAVPE